MATGKYIFLWTGKHANNMEKVQGIRIAEAIRAEHSNHCERIVIVDDGEEVLGLSAQELKAFEEFLPLDKKCVDSWDPKEDELKYEMTERAEVVLYRCKEENGSLQINKVKNGPLFKTDLDSNVIINYNDFKIFQFRHISNKRILSLLTIISMAYGFGSGRMLHVRKSLVP